MRIQNLSILSPLKMNNIPFKQKESHKLSDLKEDTFEKQLPSVKYYYLGADDKAHETTAPFVTKPTEYGDRLYIIRSGKPRAFSGFTVEKDDDRQKTVIFESGYPRTVEETEDERNSKITVYNPVTHKIQMIEKGAFKIDQSYSNSTFTTEIRNKKDGKEIRTFLNMADDGNDISSAEVIISDFNGENKEDNVLLWNHLGEVPDKINNMDKETAETFYKNLKDMAITINHPDYFKYFGRNNKFNFTLEELIRYFGKKIS